MFLNFKIVPQILDGINVRTIYLRDQEMYRIRVLLEMATLSDTYCYPNGEHQVPNKTALPHCYALRLIQITFSRSKTVVHYDAFTSIVHTI